MIQNTAHDSRETESVKSVPVSETNPFELSCCTSCGGCFIFRGTPIVVENLDTRAYLCFLQMSGGSCAGSNLAHSTLFGCVATSHNGISCCCNFCGCQNPPTCIRCIETGSLCLLCCPLVVPMIYFGYDSSWSHGCRPCYYVVHNTD